MDYIEITAKTIDDAITEALLKLNTSSDNIEYEVIEKGSTGFLGLGGKLAKIKVKKKFSIENVAKEFAEEVFKNMNIKVNISLNYNKEDNVMDIELSGDEMGLIIGKRGQTLDSLQYLISLVVNKQSENYIKIKLDTENYRERRKETLETLAKNIAYKVKRTKRPVSLEPMNPYERRLIHSVLQNDNYIETYSEGDEPYRRVVVTLKRNNRYRSNHHNNNSNNNNSNNNNN